MLWRASFEPKVLLNLALPTCQVEGSSKSLNQVWIASFSIGTVSDQGVWWRLMRSSFPNDDDTFKVFVSKVWSTKRKQETLSSVPPSEQRSVLFVSDTEEIWSDLVQPDKPERGFAMIISGNTIRQMVVGPPTEEVWEEFRDSWTELRK